MDNATKLENRINPLLRELTATRARIHQPYLLWDCPLFLQLSSLHLSVKHGKLLVFHPLTPLLPPLLPPLAPGPILTGPAAGWMLRPDTPRCTVATPPVEYGGKMSIE